MRKTVVPIRTKASTPLNAYHYVLPLHAFSPMPFSPSLRFSCLVNYYPYFIDGENPSTKKLSHLFSVSHYWLSRLGHVLDFWALSCGLTQWHEHVCSMALHEKDELVSLTKHALFFPQQRNWWVLEKNPSGRFNTWLFKLYKENSLLPNMTKQQSEHWLHRAQGTDRVCTGQIIGFIQL